MRHLLEARSVAVVGRAGSLYGSGNGAAIDAADVVIRINWLLPIPPDQAQDVGSRTDIVYHCKRARAARRAARKRGVATYRVSGKYRRKVAERFFKRPKAFRPTTGFMAIIETVESGAREVRCFGFDLFRSGHIQERMPGADNYAKPLGWTHNPEEERRALRKLIAQSRGVIRPDATMAEALK